MLKETLPIFGITQSRTTAYHPQGNGMVERLNRSLLRSYVDKEPAYYKHYLPLVLYAYRTTVHSSTGVSPFQLMFCRQPRSSDLDHQLAFDASSYQGHFQTKLAELCDLVETNLVEAATQQMTTYNRHSYNRSSKLVI